MKRLIVSIVIGFIICGCAWGASENDETLLQEIKALREEIAALRQELAPLLGRSRAKGNNESPTDSAIASNIVSNLRALKSACIMFAYDSNGQPPADVTAFIKYVDNPSNFPEGHYLFEVVNDNWYIGFSAKNAAVSDEVKKKLSERANSLGLTSTPDRNGEQYTDQDVVWMIAK